MHLAVIRITGAEFDPDSFTERHGFHPDAKWLAGQRDAGGLARAQSGLNLTIADEPSVSELAARIRAWVQANSEVLQTLDSLGASAVLDVGVTVGSPEQFTASVMFQPSDLAVFAQAGLGLCVSAYPVGEHMGTAV